MKWFPADREKSILILISLGIVFFIAAIMYFQPPFFNHWIIKLEDDTYDRQVRRYYRPLSPHPSIAILDVDDRSIEEEGRWPWDRAKIGKLASELDRLGAKVIAFDMVFSEPQENPVDAILKVSDNPSLARELEPLKSVLDADSIFADALKKGKNVLGFAFATNGKEEGVLPSPLLSISEEDAKTTLIPNMNGYIGNQPLLQKAAGHGGFINAMIDSDGILRFSPLLMRENEKVYPALALTAAKIFLSLPFSGIATSTFREGQFIKSIQLGPTTIPTDPWGRILIPFRGPPYSFPYLSATDLLHGKITDEQVRGKLIFIGMSATASSDLLATAISPAFPGVEIQASIASGIIDNYLPYKPNWGRGVAVIVVLILGIIAAFTFPYMGRIAAFLFSFVIIIASEGVNYWLWTKHGMVLSFFFPAPTLIFLFILDLMGVYIADIRQKKELKRIFGQTVHPEYLDRLIRKKGDITLTGEHKELTILVSQIWDFSSITDPLSTTEIKEFLNLYFTEMNQIIFDQKGIVDKYMRDEIMAFWGAPLPEPKHSFLAVKTALAMKGKISSFHPPIKIGIGINTGNAHVGDMGSKFTRAFTAIGYPVDLAHHLKDLTEFYSVPIIAGETTWKYTQETFIYRKLDRIEFKGKTEVIYEPICLKEQLSSALETELKMHNEALSAYLAKNWEKAEGLFRKLQTASPQNSELYQVYLNVIATNKNRA